MYEPGSYRIYHWGDQAPDCSRLKYWHYDGSSYEYCVGDTVHVGSYPTGASPFGGLDMSGNVWEWVDDWYGEDYYRNSPYSNPFGPADGTYKVVRGRAWHSFWDSVRSAVRATLPPTASSYSLGLRCAASGPGD
jgi:formylglycine-generating enzyme required for sulfatase activity